eukprot:6202195-Pleurochrysis_carterae.AAC.3
MVHACARARAVAMHACVHPRVRALVPCVSMRTRTKHMKLCARTPLEAWSTHGASLSCCDARAPEMRNPERRC